MVFNGLYPQCNLYLHAILEAGQASLCRGNCHSNNPELHLQLWILLKPNLPYFCMYVLVVQAYIIHPDHPTHSVDQPDRPDHPDHLTNLSILTTLIPLTTLTMPTTLTTLITATTKTQNNNLQNVQKIVQTVSMQIGKKIDQEREFENKYQQLVWNNNLYDSQKQCPQFANVQSSLLGG